MPSPWNRPPELLALCRDEATLRNLLGGLSREGVCVDLAHDLGELRDVFFRRGGHQMILLGPDLSPSFAHEAMNTLQAVDPDLQFVIFGEDLARRAQTKASTVVTSFHPSSRAGLGAVLAALRGPTSEE